VPEQLRDPLFQPRSRRVGASLLIADTADAIAARMPSVGRVWASLYRLIGATRVGASFRHRKFPATYIHAMSVFTASELRYLTGGHQLGRIATVGADGTPHVVPVGWIYNAPRDTIDVAGIELARTKKFRDIARTGRVAIVIDDLESVDPWRPRGLEVRGRGETIALPTPLIRIHPERIVSWGLGAGRTARTVAGP
jgi:pyridoxamine 5'-phosphate oxidase family protein